MITSNPSEFECTQYLSVSCVFHIRVILHQLDVSLSHEDNLKKAKNSYIKSAFYSNFDYYGANVGQTWINRHWFYKSAYDNFMDGRKTRESSPAATLHNA